MSQVDVYPSPSLPTQSAPQSNGSFAPVLIVLAVIFVLVIISVVLGRICNRRYHSSKGEHSHVKGASKGKGKGKKSNQKDKFRHNHHHPSAPGEGTDIEFGFDKRFSSAKVASNGDHFDFKVPKMPQMPQMPQMPRHGGGGGGPGGGGGGGGELKVPVVRFANDHHIEFRTGA